MIVVNRIAIIRDLWIGRLLRVGVIASSFLLMTGLVVTFASGEKIPSRSTAMGKEIQLQSVSPGTISEGLISGSSTAFIQLGLLVLILTPVARVGLTLLFFRRERELFFTICAGVVFVILVLGLIGVGAF